MDRHHYASVQHSFCQNREIRTQNQTPDRKLFVCTRHHRLSQQQHLSQREAINLFRLKFVVDSLFVELHVDRRGAERQPDFPRGLVKKGVLGAGQPLQTRTGSKRVAERNFALWCDRLLETNHQYRVLPKVPGARTGCLFGVADGRQTEFVETEVFVEKSAVASSRIFKKKVVLCKKGVVQREVGLGVSEVKRCARRRELGHTTKVFHHRERTVGVEDEFHEFLGEPEPPKRTVDELADVGMQRDRKVGLLFAGVGHQSVCGVSVVDVGRGRAGPVRRRPVLELSVKQLSVRQLVLVEKIAQRVPVPRELRKAFWVEGADALGEVCGKDGRRNVVVQNSKGSSYALREPEHELLRSQEGGQLHHEHVEATGHSRTAVFRRNLFHDRILWLETVVVQRNRDARLHKYAEPMQRLHNYVL